MRGIFPFVQDSPIVAVIVLRPPELTLGVLGGLEHTLGPPVAAAPRIEILVAIIASVFVSIPGNP